MDFDDLVDEPFDLDLLLSVSSGLGHAELSGDGKRQVYVKDTDCVGKYSGKSVFGAMAPVDVASHAHCRRAPQPA